MAHLLAVTGEQGCPFIIAGGMLLDCRGFLGGYSPGVITQICEVSG